MTKLVRYTFSVNRINNGIFTLDKPIKGVSTIAVTQIIFKHGPKKKTRKTRKKRKDDDSDDSDIPFENGNPDLIDATYISIQINDFIRGMVYNEDGQLTDPYTIRIFGDLSDSGEGYWERNLKDIDWKLEGQPANTVLEQIKITTNTDLDCQCRHINYDIEIEFGLDNI